MLEEWAEWKRDPEISCFPSESSIYRICRNMPPTGEHGDGGMAANAAKLGYLLQRDGRCREVNELIYSLPVEYQRLILARFDVAPKEKTRSERAAAEMLNLSQVTYRERFKNVTGWLCGRLAIPLDAA